MKDSLKDCIGLTSNTITQIVALLMVIAIILDGEGFNNAIKWVITGLIGLFMTLHVYGIVRLAISIKKPKKSMSVCCQKGKDGNVKVEEVFYVMGSELKWDKRKAKTLTSMLNGEYGDNMSREAEEIVNLMKRKGKS